ncbi:MULTISPECIES: universal stress protein [Primorskyibacter]|uniref:Nucleotide-binding universal stress protein, UspA family n=1 Tax=Primorskyibacter flagellatus TaxID=1387277 RepID=A0A1W2BZD0_9RHOB|nr:MULTISPECIES: universal stress protein [Primorskyibacter]SMC78250.1 Nucleotide-binding universal stress protein, UspA family [Primorskyibacter flagellatus]
MSKSVLCAVDINETGQEVQVLERAAQLAVLDGASLDVVTVVPDFGSSMVAGFFEAHHHEKAVKHVSQELHKFVENILGAENAKNVRHIVSTGKAYEEILKVARETTPELIVLGAHKPDLKDYLLGPNAARVVRFAKSSVYVVR